MRRFILATLAVAWLAQLAPRAQSKDSSPEQAKKAKLVSVIGCVVSDEAMPGRFTIADPKEGVTYRLSGRDMKKYLGQRVEVTGGPPSRFGIGFGLVPSPNAAAQAGAVDPPPAAAAGAARPGPLAPVEEFRVRSVKTVTGECPK